MDEGMLGAGCYPESTLYAYVLVVFNLVCIRVVCLYYPICLEVRGQLVRVRHLHSVDPGDQTGVIKFGTGSIT